MSVVQQVGHLALGSLLVRTLHLRPAGVAGVAAAGQPGPRIRRGAKWYAVPVKMVLQFFREIHMQQPIMELGTIETVNSIAGSSDICHVNEPIICYDHHVNNLANI